MDIKERIKKGGVGALGRRQRRRHISMRKKVSKKRGVSPFRGGGQMSSGGKENDADTGGGSLRKYS